MRIYTLLIKRPEGNGISMSFTNLTILCEFVGEKVKYNTLLHHFTRKKMTWYEDPYANILIVRSPGLMRGKQRVKMQPKGHNRNI